MLLEWIRRLVAGKELDELERWNVEWQWHRSWLTEFGEVSETLDNLKLAAKGHDHEWINDFRDRLRKAVASPIEVTALERQCDDLKRQIVDLQYAVQNHNELLSAYQFYKARVAVLMERIRLLKGGTEGYDLVTHIRRQRAFSRKTFGPGSRTAGVVAHIRKELIEIEADPADLMEWVDVILLALDGAWRAGHEPNAIAAAIEAKQTRNENRTWPDWRTAPADGPIEHVRNAADSEGGEQ